MVAPSGLFARDFGCFASSTTFITRLQALSVPQNVVCYVITLPTLVVRRFAPHNSTTEVLSGAPLARLEGSFLTFSLARFSPVRWPSASGGYYVAPLVRSSAPPHCSFLAIRRCFGYRIATNRASTSSASILATVARHLLMRNFLVSHPLTSFVPQEVRRKVDKEVM